MYDMNFMEDLFIIEDTSIIEEPTGYALNLAEDNRILSATLAKFAPVNAVIVDELPTGETEAEKNIHNWLYQDGEYIYNPLPVVDNSVAEEIASLKAELQSTDYKIIKCSEARLVGELLPYNINELHAERQALRDKINALEGGVE